MTVYRLSRLLETEEELYLLSGKQPQPCTVYMSAVKPKRVKRSIELFLDGEDAALLCQDRCGRILWRAPLPLYRESDGKAAVDITNVLRERGVSFSFCPVGRLRRAQARPDELETAMRFYDWGYMTSREGYCWDSPGNTCLTFYPGKVFACGAEIFRVRPEAFGWDGDLLRRQAESMSAPMLLDDEAVCRLMEAWGDLSRLSLSGGNISLELRAFFLTSFEVEGFGRRWNCGISPSLFAQNGCAPCKTARFAPLICRLLKASSAEEVACALRRGVEEDVLCEGCV